MKHKQCSTCHDEPYIPPEGGGECVCPECRRISRHLIPRDIVAEALLRIFREGFVGSFADVDSNDRLWWNSGKDGRPPRWIGAAWGEAKRICRYQKKPTKKVNP